MRFMLSNSIMI